MSGDAAEPAQRYTGAGCDMSAIIRTHLFILAPNNSGSTFLRKAIAESHAAWSFEVEGQFIRGFHGPSTRQTRTPLIWAARPDWQAHFTDPASYDWVKTRRAWHFTATAPAPDASVLVTSSPPFLLIADMLADQFPDGRFLVLVRDPYAAVEGICRRRTRIHVPPGEDLRTLAAEHLLACFERQIANIAMLGDRAVHFTYETMCADPRETADRIRRLVPDLDDLELDRSLPVKGQYDERLRNMNDQQIAQLGADDFATINRVFDRNRAVFDHFGYPRRG